MVSNNVITQPNEKRTKNFNEVSLGYSKRVATDEARRCPQCADPVCVRGCPLEINIPAFIRHLREGNAKAAYDVIREQNSFPSICGRICTAPCEAVCVLNEEKAPIGIRALERYAADYGRNRPAKKDPQVKRNVKIAIVGSGPAGLSAATALAQSGYGVTIFESMDLPGGILRYGIPEFRLPRKVLDAEINDIKALGVDIRTNVFIGQTLNFSDLFKEGFGAILLATGAGIPKFMDLPGTYLGGVYYGEEFLMRVNLIKGTVFAKHKPNFFIGQKIAVIGSGNTALDCARAAVRFGKDVTLIFRRTEDEMYVRSEERELAKEEGIKLEPLVRPLEILANTHHFVGGLKCIRMDYAQTDGNEKWQLLEVPDSEFVLDVDTVIIGTGHKPNSYVKRSETDLKLNKDETIVVDLQTGMTSIPKVFACGNVVTNAGPVVEAIASGKKAAANIENFLK